MIEHTFFLPIFTAATDEKYFSTKAYFLHNKGEFVLASVTRPIDKQIQEVFVYPNYSI